MHCCVLCWPRAADALCIRTRVRGASATMVICSGQLCSLQHLRSEELQHCVSCPGRQHSFQPQWSTWCLVPCSAPTHCCMLLAGTRLVRTTTRMNGGDPMAMALPFCIGVCGIGSCTVHGLARRQGQLVGVPLHRRHVTLCIRCLAWCVAGCTWKTWMGRQRLAVWCVVGGWALSAVAEACVLTVWGRGWADSNTLCCCPGLCSQLRLQCNSMCCQTGYCALQCCGHAGSACLVFPHLHYRRRTTLSPLGHSV